MYTFCLMHAFSYKNCDFFIKAQHSYTIQGSSSKYFLLELPCTISKNELQTFLFMPGRNFCFLGYTGANKSRDYLCLFEGTDRN